MIFLKKVSVLIISLLIILNPYETTLTFAKSDDNDILFIKSMDIASPTARVIYQYINYYNSKLTDIEKMSIINAILCASHEFKIDPFIITAIIHQESTFKSRAYSSGNYGLMQVNWKVHGDELKDCIKSIKTVDDLYIHHNAVRAGTYIYTHKLERAKGNVQLALKYYCGGSKKYSEQVYKKYQTLKATNNTLLKSLKITTHQTK